MTVKACFSALTLAVFSSFVSDVSAGTVTGGTLLSNTDADQLETWLGSGDLDFTNIWSGDAGVATAASFHAAADGVGPTFSLYSITNGDGSNAIIGGYTQADWAGSGYYEDPTSFIFNLTFGEMQQVEASRVHWSVRREVNYFPTFGAGHDIFVGTTILGTQDGNANNTADGYSYSYSYDVSQGQITIAGDSGTEAGSSGTHYTHWSVNSLEVYTFAPATLPPVPVPAGLPLMAGALGLLAWTGRRRLLRG